METEQAAAAEHSISRLPDECLAHVFHFLSASDRNTCSSVSRRWLHVDARTRRVISLSATPDLTPALPSILARFMSVSIVALQGKRGSPSVGDDGLLALARLCPNLTALRLFACHSLTDAGLAAFAAAVAPGLREISFTYCGFCVAGLNKLLKHCTALESITLESMTKSDDFNNIRTVPSAVASLRTLSLGHFFTGNRFAPLIVAAENLTTFKAVMCSGDWDAFFSTVLEDRGNRLLTITELHLVQLIIRDDGLRSVAACCPNLEILRLGSILTIPGARPKFTDAGVAAIVQSCKRLRDLHIDAGFEPTAGGDECLFALADHCPGLQRLKLVGAIPSSAGWDAVTEHCLKLELLTVRRVRTFDDAAMACIGANCRALREINIKWCRGVSDVGLMELGRGCPRLEKVKLNKCPGITTAGVDSLLSIKGNSIAVLAGLITS